MAAKVDICNRALMLIGQDTLSSVNDDSPRGRICFREFDAALDATLRSYHWPFAIKRAKLARLVDEPEFEYKYYYELPHDMLRIVEIFSDGEHDRHTWYDGSIDSSSTYVHRKPYEIEGHRIATNMLAVNLKYIAKIRPEDLDAITNDVVAYKLAAVLCTVLIENPEMKQLLLQEHAMLMSQARHTWSVESYPAIPLEGPWLKVR